MHHRRGIPWWLGNGLLVLGVAMMLYFAIVYLFASYNRLAARGDSALPVYEHGLHGKQAEHTSCTSPLCTPIAFQIPSATVTDTLDAQVTSPSVQKPPTQRSKINRIVISAIDVDSKVITIPKIEEEVDGEIVSYWHVPNYVVGHLAGTANPGNGSNIVLTGHVGGYSRVFQDLYAVQQGDTVRLHSNEQLYTYVVQERLLLDEVGVSPEQQAENARYADPTDEEVVTLITCWPPEGKEKYTQRLILRAVPTSF